MKNTNLEIKMRLIELGGRTTQDLGLGRIVGQIGMYLYLSKGDSSLDDVAESLGLSKASVSIAARQLESFGLVQRVWKKGDRKNYYKMVEHFGVALKRGLMKIIWGKVELVSTELQNVDGMLATCDESMAVDELTFMKKKVARAKDICVTAEKLLNNPIVGALVK